MITVFTVNNVVIGVGTSTVASVSSGTNSVDYVVPDNTPIGVGWAVAVVNGNPVFTAPATFALLSPTNFYAAFTATEMIAIRSSTDKYVQEFLARFQVFQQANEMINPNSVSVQEGLAYLATPATVMTPVGTPGPGILASTARIAQISAGMPQ